MSDDDLTMKCSWCTEYLPDELLQRSDHQEEAWIGLGRLGAGGEFRFVRPVYIRTYAMVPFIPAAVADARPTKKQTFND
jgi:hypothetical protein